MMCLSLLSSPINGKFPLCIHVAHVGTGDTAFKSLSETSWFTSAAKVVISNYLMTRLFRIWVDMAVAFEKARS
jgi:hypothetical protein